MNKSILHFLYSSHKEFIQNHTDSIVSNDQKLDIFLTRSETIQECYLSLLDFQNYYVIQVAETSLIHNLICRFNAIPVKFPASYFLDNSRLILKFIWKEKRPMIDNNTKEQS